MARRPLGGLLRQRDFRLLWLGETTNGLGAAVSTVAIPLVAVTTLHASAFLVASLGAAVWLPWLPLALPVGALIDRWPRRPIMVACDLVWLVSLASVPVAAWLGVLTFGHLFAVALLSGATSVFFTTAYRAYLPSLVAPADLVEGNAKLQGSASAAQVAGPGLGGLLAQAFGIVTGLLADAASCLVSLACLLAIRTQERRPRDTTRSTTLGAEIADGVRFLAYDPYLRLFAVFAAADNFTLDGTQAILVVFGASAQLLNFGVIPIGALVAGGLADALGVRSAVLVMCASSVLAALLLLTGPLRHRRDLPAAVGPVAVDHTSP